MTDPTLKRLGALSKTLNEASDVISKQIAGIESALNALRLGVWAWVEVERERVVDEFEDSETKEKSHCELTRVLQLGYTRHRGNWALVVMDHFEELDPDEAETVPLREAKRDIKLAAVEKIPELLKAIEDKARKVTEDAARKANVLRDMAWAFGQQAGAGSKGGGT